MTEAKIVLFLTSLFIKVSFTLLHGLEGELYNKCFYISLVAVTAYFGHNLKDKLEIGFMSVGT